MLRRTLKWAEGKGYLGWEGSALHAGWLGKVAFELKPKRSEGATYAYTREWSLQGYGAAIQEHAWQMR